MSKGLFQGPFMSILLADGCRQNQHSRINTIKGTLKKSPWISGSHQSLILN